MKTMTKAEALDYFASMLIQMRRKEKGVPNYAARTKAWLGFISDLRSEGVISQRARWTLPQFCRPQRPHQTEAEYIEDLNRGYAQDRG